MFLKKNIETICNKIEKRFIGNSSLEITGPLHLLENIQFIKDIIFLDLSENAKYILYNGIKIMDLVKNIKPEIRKEYTQKYYNNLWNERRIYKDNLIIPHNIYQTHKSKEYIDDIKATNSWKNYKNFNYFFYNDQEMDQFMLDNCNDIYEIYQQIDDKYLKIDLFKYSIIYQNGGIYADCNMTCHKIPSFMIKKSYFVGVAENKLKLSSKIFASSKHSPLVKEIINLLVDSLKSKNNTEKDFFTLGIEKWLLHNNKKTFKNKLHYQNYDKKIIYCWPQGFYRKLIN